MGEYKGAINWLRDNPRKVSAHYVVSEDGSEITMYEIAQRLQRGERIYEEELIE